MLALLSHTNPPGSDGEDSGLPSSIFQKPGLHLLAVLAVQLFNSLAAMPRVHDAVTNGFPPEISHLLDLCCFQCVIDQEPAKHKCNHTGNLIIILVRAVSTLSLACTLTSIKEIRTALCRTVRKPPTINDTACMKSAFFHHTSATKYLHTTFPMHHTRHVA
jgi:hypothetical protein